MPDPIFEHPRLIEIYDSLDPDRRDLDAYLEIVDELGAASVLDIGCGTGTFALLLAQRGVDVVGVDPAAGALSVARGKPGAERVTWILGDATQLPPLAVDLVTITGNAAQAIIDDSAWEGTVGGTYAALRPGGALVFETRNPAYRAWEEWNRANSYQKTEVQGVGEVECWVDLLGVSGSLVTFRWTFVFASDGATITSDSTLRFRGQSEIEEALQRCGYEVQDVRGAPDRPGREFVFIARRPDRAM